MANSSAAPDKPLNIVHVLRAPLGGLFRHVLDLAHEQHRRGHRVGLIADSSTGGPNAERILAEIEPHLALGILRLPMRRNPHVSDIAALAKVSHWCREASVDVIHGHGSKGGLYARLVGGASAVRAYTPHGGSLNHRPGTLIHRIYMQAERLMAMRTDLLLFESGYIAERFQKLVGLPPGLFKVVRNGIAPSEFAPVTTAADAADFLYVGELRAIKGIDTMLEALAVAGRMRGTKPRAVLVGTGPEKDALERHAHRLGLADTISFAGSLPARQAFERGKILIVPSRAESLPYIVLEAAGARVPILATNVGGIPEIFGPYKNRLMRPDSVAELAQRMSEAIDAPGGAIEADAADLARFVESRFSIETMVDGILAAYGEALSHRDAGRPKRSPALAIPSYDRGSET